MLKNLFKSKVLYIQISESYINIRGIDKQDLIKNYINVQLPKSTIENGQVKDFIYMKKVMKDHLDQMKEKFDKIILVIDVDSIMRFAEYPNLEKKKLASAVQYSFAEHFPVDLSLYTTDYRLISQTKDKSKVLLVGVEKGIIAGYLSIFENIKIRLDTIDIYSNFINLYLGEYDKGSIIVGILRENKIILQFIENGELSYIQESDYTNMDSLFRIFNNNIERAYLPVGTKGEMINFFRSKSVEVISMEHLVPIAEQSVLKAKNFWE